MDVRLGFSTASHSSFNVHVPSDNQSACLDSFSILGGSYKINHTNTGNKFKVYLLKGSSTFAILILYGEW
jgi:hypothetical protein